MSSSWRTTLPCLLVIAAFAAGCWLPTRLSDDAHFLLLTLAFFLALAILYIIARGRPATFRDDMPDPSCARCGYSLRGHAMPAIRCPECGTDLGPRDIIVGKDVWVTNVRRCLRWLTLLLIAIMLECPFYLPRRATRALSLACDDPVSKAYAGLSLTVFQKAWVFPFGLPIPWTERSDEMELQVSMCEGIPGMKLDPLIPSYAQWPYHEGINGVRGPLLESSGVLDYVAVFGVDVHSEKVRQEVSAVWACYQAVVNHVESEPPLKLFRHCRINKNEKWDLLAWPAWRPRAFAAAGLVLWLLVALRIRHRAMIEASLAGPHGLTLMRNQNGERNDSSTR
jgi:hypothetical protein